mgnify:CR=1 FL=1
MKKYLAIILAILTFAAAFPPIVGSAADEPVPVEISARAEKELIENFDLVPGSDGNGNEYYDYNINDANPMITVKYSNGTETEKSLADWQSEGVMFYYLPVFAEGENLWKAGSHKYLLTYLEYSLTCYMDVTVAKNPIDSISAVITGKNSFYENTHGYINKDENGEEYYYYSADWIMREIFMPTLTVNYNDGRGSVTVKYGDWDSFQEQTGYHLEISDSQYTKHWTLGENTLTLSCLGIECELPFTIKEFPIKSISAAATATIAEGDTYTRHITYEDGSEISYEYYEPELTHPTITLTLADNTTEVYEWENYYEISEKYGLHPYFESEQSADVKWEAGVHTATVCFGNLTADFEVEIIGNPIESFSVIPTKKLIENINGVNGEDENGNSYFNYYIFDTQPRYIIKLKNENEPRIYESWQSYQIHQDFGTSVSIIDNQSYNNQFKLGKNTLEAKFMGLTTDYVFEITENPISEITVKPNGALYLGCNKTVDINNKEIYDLYSIEYTVTVKYKDKSTVVYSSLSDLYAETGYSLVFDTDNQIESPWNEAGIYTVKASLLGVETSFQIEMRESPYVGILISEIGNKLIITLTRNDNQKEEYSVLSLEANSGDFDMRLGTVITDSEKLYNVKFRYDTELVGSEDNGIYKENFGKGLYIEYLNLTSNKIDSKWFEAYMELDNIALVYANIDSYSGFRGRVTADRLDDMLHLAAYIDQDFTIDCILNGKTVPGDSDYFSNYKVSAEEAAALLEKHFGTGSADIALSKNYNPDDNTVIIKNKALFELSHRDICVFNPDNKEWTYRNGAITITRGAEDTSFKAGVTGDVDLNGSVDVLDLIKLKKAAAEANTAYNAFYDVDGDGSITAADIAYIKLFMFEVPAREKGDVNGDGSVDKADTATLTLLINGRTEAEYAPYADINRDGYINEEDISALEAIIKEAVKKNT